MQWFQRTTILGAVVAMLAGCVQAPEPARERPDPPRQVMRQAVMIDCSGPHRLRIVDLDMAPDPVRNGQPIDLWRITIQSDWDGECSTALTVRDQNEVAGRGQAETIVPGRAVYTIPALPDYRFQRQDACFQVEANVGGRYTRIEAQRTFCVHARPRGWSLRDS